MFEQTPSPLKPLIMGVLNVTPDSFSDGGLFLDSAAAIERAHGLLAEGADIIDIGGESTRPGSLEVSLSVELERVLPVLKGLRSFTIARSIDTQKFEVAKEAVRLGVTIINDVSGGRDPRFGGLVAQNPQLKLIVMHMQGTPQTMQVSPTYACGVVQEVHSFLCERAKRLEELGVRQDQIWVDPGIGFGKTLEQNLQLLRELSTFIGIGERVMIGTSRKSFLAKLIDDTAPIPVSDRLPGTISSTLYAYARGASVLRVHDVLPLKRALQTWQAIEKK